MNYKKILVTGGAGFVGSNICVKLKEHFQNIQVLAIDNLIRRGSELNIPRLLEFGVRFVHGDVRNRVDLELGKFDLLIECSAEASVMSGVNSSPSYVVDTNLGGALNCFEIARKNKADVVFLSTSRVYPVGLLNSAKYQKEDTRFSLTNNQTIKGVSEKGISEEFPLLGFRTLYGATKISSEFILLEYINNYGMRGIIDRCALLAGPWQMGKVDQGVVAYWMAKHVFKKPLAYIGFEGLGKQVRDVLDIDDLFDLLMIQLSDIKKYSGEVFNVGGGIKNSVSLLELTKFCQDITGHKVEIHKEYKTRQGDVRIYISDNSKIIRFSKWRPKKPIKNTLQDIYSWIINYKDKLEPFLS